MRSKRALMAGVLAGLGTTGTMVASAASLFFVASTLIAFNSWSDSAISDQVQSLFVGDHAPSVVSAPSGPKVVAPSVSAAAASVAPARRVPTPRAPAAARPVDRASDTGPSTTPAEPDVVAATGGGTGPPSKVSDSGPSPRPVAGGSDSHVVPVPADHPATPTLGGVVQDTTGTLAGTVEQTTGQLGSTVGGVSQPLGNVVTQTGQTLGGTITYTGQTLGGVLNGNR